MALTDPYLTVAEMKSRMKISDARDDAAIERVLKAASRQIDQWTGRCFNQSDASTVKYLTPQLSDVLEVPDLVSVDEIAGDNGNRAYLTTWATTDFDLFPYDAEDRGWPYTEVRTSPASTRAFVGYPKGMRITGVWGWPAVPEPIVEATALQAHRLWKRQSAPFGVVGAPELGQMQTISRIDPDVQILIAPYRVLAL